MKQTQQNQTRQIIIRTTAENKTKQTKQNATNKADHCKSA